MIQCAKTSTIPQNTNSHEVEKVHFPCKTRFLATCTRTCPRAKGAAQLAGTHCMSSRGPMHRCQHCHRQSLAGGVDFKREIHPWEMQPSATWKKTIHQKDNLETTHKATTMSKRTESSKSTWLLSFLLDTVLPAFIFLRTAPQSCRFPSR